MEMQSLSDICEYRKGKISISELTEKNYVSTENLMPNKGGLVEATNLPSTDTTPIYYAGDVLVSNIRPYFKKIWLAKEDGGCSNDVLVFKAKPGVESTFLYYVLANDKFFDYSTASSKGTKMPRGDKSAIMMYEVPKYDVGTQKKIGEMLSSIDGKIQVNTQINRNLSEQALTMVSGWEANEQDNIEYKDIASVADLNPDTYSPKEEWNFVNYLDTSSITEGTVSELTYIVPAEEKLPSRARRKLKADDIVYSTVRPNQKHYGYISQPTENMLASTGFVVVRARKDVICSELLYLLITRDVVTEKMQQIAEGSTSTFPSIKPSDLGSYEIPVPKKNSNTTLIDGLNDIFKCINSNQEENRRLAELRDSLLPKLMSGELDVSDLEI